MKKANTCDKCGLSDRCKGERFCRRCYVRMFGHEPESKGSNMKIVAMVPAVFMAGCLSIPKARSGGGASSGAGTAGAACDGGWWSQIAGLGVLNWMGGLLILLGGAAFVGTFIPAVGAFFPRKMSVSCVIAGVASIFLYNLLTEYAWVVYITLAVGGVLLALSYWPPIKEMAIRLWELVTRKDEDGDGKIGPQ